ncbi:RNA polymerase sigma factor for flagellar operon FliA [Cerasibacillus quisquiliarum]|uniref:RNA polymerase sigma factor n=1 Tax=Cerasibacillus quisquiliarum TaxID=227865 RepID=A0A511UZA6_9BACI|nr:FliA/WhiG family RNA polymerase sigma factor [Cerasibacillus quisquiliarum]MBB5145881.1 RNA polymerase sigma factor for flagellar operon FliA [Cerasibacillus quisquiliarum]GEN30452.1 RNA polymerase sigma-D factor [Cerasibacillus quisquiliarum]
MSTHLSSLEEKLWDNFLANKNGDAASRLIDNYMYLVHFHVERIATHLPPNVLKDDLISYGMVGLYDAIKKFERKRGLKFDTYASFRIRGAIIDGLRKEDWVPRSMREKMKKIDETSRILEQKYEREPTAEEIAKEVNMTVDEVETVMRDTLFSNIMSIDEQPNDHYTDQKEGIGYAIPDNKVIQPEEKLLMDELLDDLEKALQTLNKNEQLIINLFYHHELTFTEIGKILDLTTSRISQIHKKAIFKLNKVLLKVIEHG